MMRGLLLFCLGCCLLTLVAAAGAKAEDLPVRKAGLWEMKLVRVGSALPDMTMQHCTDETTDKDMNNMVSPLAKQICSKQDVQKTATGYISDSVCSLAAGASLTSHSEIVGDFSSAYRVTTVSHSDKGPANLRDSTTKIEAKWLGDCKPGQKPGDIVMPGGFKLNVKDAEKLKGLLPK
jgi:Protein of unknown function (DUF3617)